ncbi:MAG: GumC family protein [Planctomycetota bacterium]
MNERNYAPAPHDSPESREKPGLDPMDVIVLPILRSKFLVLFLTCLGVGGGIFFSLLLPNEYTSNGKVRLLLGVRERLTASPDDPDQADRALGKSAVLEELYLLRTPEVYERVAERVGPLEVLRPYDPAGPGHPRAKGLMRKMHEFQSWWFGRNDPTLGHVCPPAADGGRSQSCPSCVRVASRTLQGRSEIVNDGKSTIISVNYTSYEASLSRKVVDAFLAAFNQIHQEKHSAAASMSLMENQREEQFEAARAAEEALTTFSREHGIVDVEAQLKGWVSEQMSLEQQIKADEGQLAFSTGELERALAQLRDEPPTIQRPLPSTKRPNPAYMGILTRLNAQEEKRAQLLVNYRPDSPEVLAVDEFIRQLREERDRVPPDLDQSQGFEVVENPEYVRLRGKQLEHDELARSARTRLERNQKRLSEVAKSLETLKHNKPRYEELTREVRRLRDNVDKYDRKLEELWVAKKLDEANQSNLEIWQSATLPAEKSGPNRLRFVLAGLAMGAVLGLALAVGRGLVDRTIRRAQEIERVVGVRVLGVVPYSSGWDRAQRSARKIPREELKVGGS